MTRSRCFTVPGRRTHLDRLCRCQTGHSTVVATLPLVVGSRGGGAKTSTSDQKNQRVGCCSMRPTPQERNTMEYLIATIPHSFLPHTPCKDTRWRESRKAKMALLPFTTRGTRNTPKRSGDTMYKRKRLQSGDQIASNCKIVQVGFQFFLESSQTIAPILRSFAPSPLLPPGSRSLARDETNAGRVQRSRDPFEAPQSAEASSDRRGELGSSTARTTSPNTTTMGLVPLPISWDDFGGVNGAAYMTDMECLGSVNHRLDLGSS